MDACKSDFKIIKCNKPQRIILKKYKSLTKRYIKRDLVNACIRNAYKDYYAKSAI